MTREESDLLNSHNMIESIRFMLENKNIENMDLGLEHTQIYPYDSQSGEPHGSLISTHYNEQTNRYFLVYFILDNNNPSIRVYNTGAPEFYGSGHLVFNLLLMNSELEDTNMIKNEGDENLRIMIGNKSSTFVVKDFTPDLESGKAYNTTVIADIHDEAEMFQNFLVTSVQDYMYNIAKHLQTINLYKKTIIFTSDYYGVHFNDYRIPNLGELYAQRSQEL